MFACAFAWIVCADLSALGSLAPTAVLNPGEGFGTITLAPMLACALALGAFACGVGGVWPSWPWRFAVRLALGGSDAAREFLLLVVVIVVVLAGPIAKIVVFFFTCTPLVVCLRPFPHVILYAVGGFRCFTLSLVPFVEVLRFEKSLVIVPA